MIQPDTKITMHRSLTAPPLAFTLKELPGIIEEHLRATDRIPISLLASIVSSECKRITSELMRHGKTTGLGGRPISL